jgi:hypothetical protein
VPLLSESTPSHSPNAAAVSSSLPATFQVPLKMRSDSCFLSSISSAQPVLSASAFCQCTACGCGWHLQVCPNVLLLGGKGGGVAACGAAASLIVLCGPLGVTGLLNQSSNPRPKSAYGYTTVGRSLAAHMHHQAAQTVHGSCGNGHDLVTRRLLFPEVSSAIASRSVSATQQLLFLLLYTALQVHLQRVPHT